LRKKEGKNMIQKQTKKNSQAQINKINNRHRWEQDHQCPGKPQPSSSSFLSSFSNFSIGSNNNNNNNATKQTATQTQTQQTQTQTQKRSSTVSNPKTTTSNSQNNNNAKETTILIRQTDGNVVKRTFPSSSLLSEVKNWIDQV
jgi:hypothetical protein